jgi:arylsulfatase A-like enzyme
MTQLPDDLADDQVREEARSPVQAAHRDTTGPRTVAEVEKWSARADGRPFFAFVHLWDVHYDYIPPRDYARLFDPDYRESRSFGSFVSDPAFRPPLDPRELQHVLALYDGEIRWTDDHLAKILEVLTRKAGGDDRLLVVVTSDHGDEFFEHGQKGHQKSLYEEVIRVPLVMRWTGHLPAGRVVEEQVRLIDLMPTLCAAAGVEAPAQVQGRDLLPWLAAGAPLPPEPALSELHVAPFALHALRTETFKVISRDRGRRVESYALDRDPGETRFAPAADPRTGPAVSRLRRLVEDSVGLRRRLEADPDLVVASPRLERMLQQLGYVGDAAAPNQGR